MLLYFSLFVCRSRLSYYQQQLLVYMILLLTLTCSWLNSAIKTSKYSENKRQEWFMNLLLFGFSVKLLVKSNAISISIFPQVNHLVICQFKTISLHDKMSIHFHKPIARLFVHSSILSIKMDFSHITLHMQTELFHLFVGFSQICHIVRWFILMIHIHQTIFSNILIKLLRKLLVFK